MDELTIHPVGDDALGIDITDRSRRDRLAEHLRQTGDWRETLPGAQSLTVQYDPMIMSPEDALRQLSRTLAAALPPLDKAKPALKIPVCYEPSSALDADHVCAVLGISAETLIARHIAATYRVDLIGFTPGFAYLEGGDPGLDIARLDTPRQRLPAGSIGIAAGLCGLYALAGPGGWPIIGRTPLALFDNQAADPFRLNTGMQVTFTQISAAEFEAWA